MCQVSIVLPSYNGEKYLCAAIDSIICQSFTDWELILVDDCSTDSTYEIMLQYEKKDGRIYVLHNSINMNLPNSLNRGFEKTSGDYVTWTSDDNTYDKHALQIMYNFLSVHPESHMVCADMRLIDSSGNIIRNAEPYNEDTFFYNNNVGACFMYDRTVLKEIGVYNSNLFGIEDYDYWLRIVCRYGHISHLNIVLYSYRIHEKSLSVQKFYEIKDKLNILRVKNFNWFFDKLKRRPNELMGLYFDMLISDACTEEMKKKFLDCVPEINIFKDFDLSKANFIIYGAGDYGKKAKELLADKALWFADSNEEKVSTKYEGIEVIDFKDAICKNIPIIVAVDAIKLFDISKKFCKVNNIPITTFHQLVRVIRQQIYI